MSHNHHTCESESHDHDHNHDHGNNHDGHNHGAPPLPTNASQSLNPKIDTSKLTALNLSNPQDELIKLFKTQDTRYCVKPIFKSDLDNQLIINIPFETSVKLYSVILRTSIEPNHCPKIIKLFKNNLGLDFDTVGSMKATFQLEHPEIGVHYSTILNSDEQEFINDDSFVEHHLPRHLFSVVDSLTIFMENNWSGDEDENLILFSVEIRGEFKGLKKESVIALYESAANPADHKKIFAEDELKMSGVI